MNNKKVIEITGFAAYPITVGENAFISESDGLIRRTSVVMKVEKISGSEIKFETKNSIYYLTTNEQYSLPGTIIKNLFNMRGCEC